MRKSTILPLLLAAVTLFSCVEKKEEKANEELLVKEATEPIKEHREKAHYPIPSPEQMFGFINDAGIDYSKSLIHDVNKAGSYNDPKSKALNFGIYTADLAYAAAYQDIESTIDLYKVVKRISSELDIAEMMSEEMLAKVQANLQNNDSLIVIAGRSYYDAVDYLEQNGQEGKLTLMSLGGWIESLYITLNAIKDFDPTSETAQRIADQKITFGNLYTFLKKNESEVGVKEEIEKVNDIRAVFASLHEERVAKSTKKSNTGKMVFSSSSKITITDIQFNDLKSAINTYRNSITN